jgi:hypothetical protein
MRAESFQMSRRSVIGVAVAALLSTGTIAIAQTAATAPPTTLTYVAEWQLPRAQWGAFAADFEKNTRPVLEKLGAAGTLVGWGAYEMVVHTEEGYSHGVWWSAASYAGLEAARSELVKSAATSASLTAATGHRDLFLRAVAGNGKPGSGAGGYLTVSRYLTKPGLAQDWRALWDKHSKPLYDDLVAKGVLSAYSIDVEEMHTDSPGWRLVVTLTPSIEAVDQFGAALDAADAKRTPDERKTIALQQGAVVEPGSHRDLFAKIIRYWSK